MCSYNTGEITDCNYSHFINFYCIAVYIGVVVDAEFDAKVNLFALNNSCCTNS